MDIGLADSHLKASSEKCLLDHVVDLESDDEVKNLIELLRGGRELPVELAQRLPVID